MIAKVKAQKLDIFIDFPPQSFPLIKSDQYRLEQILSNFINNAIKFTKEGYVILRANPKIVSESQILVRIEVEDTGVGISEEDQKKLFGAFTQVHSTLSTQMGGVGLGLRICKKLIQMMGGEIGVISEKDKGTTFWVEIPFELGSSLEGTARNLSGNKVCLLDSKVKESELIAKYLQSWKVEVIQDASQARFVIASEENLSKAQESKLPILLISDFDLKNIPERVIACLSRPIIPSALFEIINTKLLNGKGES